MIYEIKDYYSNDGGVGRQIKEYIIVDGSETPEDFPKFVGVGMLEMQVGPETIPQQFSAKIDVETLKEAFEQYDSVMDEASKKASEQFKQQWQQNIKAQQEAESTKIVVPGEE